MGTIRLFGGGALDNCDFDNAWVGTDASKGALGISFTTINQDDYGDTLLLFSISPRRF